MKILINFILFCFFLFVLFRFIGAKHYHTDNLQFKYPDLSIAALYSLSCFSKVCHLKQNLTDDAALSESRQTISVHAHRAGMLVLLWQSRSQKEAETHQWFLIKDETLRESLKWPCWCLICSMFMCGCRDDRMSGWMIKSKQAQWQILHVSVKASHVCFL